MQAEGIDDLDDDDDDDDEMFFFCGMNVSGSAQSLSSCILASLRGIAASEWVVTAAARGAGLRATLLSLGALAARAGLYARRPFCYLDVRGVTASLSQRRLWSRRAMGRDGGRRRRGFVRLVIPFQCSVEYFRKYMFVVHFTECVP